MGYMEKDIDPLIQIEADIIKAEQKYKELKNEMSQLNLDIHVLQMNLTTLKNILKQNQKTQ